MTRARVAARPQSPPRRLRPTTTRELAGHLAGSGLVVLVACVSCHNSGSATAAPRVQMPTTHTDASIWRHELALAQQAELQRAHVEARAYYQAAYQHAPNDHAHAQVARQFADTLLSWGEFTEAQTQLELVVTHQPSQAAGWHDLGMVRFRLGLPAGAEVALRRAVALVPGEPRPRIALAALLWANHRGADALREYQALRHLALPIAVRNKVDWAITQLSRPVVTTPPPTTPLAL